MKIKIIIAGSRGRMGAVIARLVNEADDMSLAGEAEKDSPLETVIDKGEMVIDFSVHDATAHNVAIAARHGKPMVIGTTGLTKEEENIVKKASSSIPIVYSSNMSIGVNVMWKLIEMISPVLAQNFKINITETHHTKKKDRPSGTAKKMLDIVLSKTGLQLDAVNVSSLREGDVVGDHTIRFANPNESIEITHHAFSRDIFAQGAIAAARWIVGKPSGLYGMKEVLNI